MDPKRYLIIGYGRFGRLAARRLRLYDPECAIILVERDGAKLKDTLPPHVTVFNEDALSFLIGSGQVESTDIIIPMVPFHLAASFIVSSVKGCGEMLYPRELDALLPNPFPLNRNVICCGRADFVCPDDCPEGDLCTVTGLPRKPLYDDLEGIEIPGFTTVVQRSSQILPGVGGYPVHDLQRLTRLIRPGKYLAATSCKCHGVVTALLCRSSPEEPAA
ncbi:MAG: hypothetical protein V1792_00905 [Pseudomonadota bacterium]